MRFVSRQLARILSFNTIIITLVIVAVYASLLQIIVNVIFHVLNSNASESIQNKERKTQLDVENTRHSNIHNLDHNEGPNDPQEFDMLNYHDDNEKDIQHINDREDIRIKELEDDNIVSSKHKLWYTQDAIIQRTKDCSKYFDVYPVLYSSQVLKKYEKKKLKPAYSLAFSHLLHKEIAIYEAFLSVYFRPNNFYCVHIDKESKDKVWKAVQGLINCYSTKMIHGKIVLIDKKDSFKVRWGRDQMLKADLKCIEKLVQLRKGSKSPWRYSISMAGSELPLVTYASLHTKLSTALKKDDSALESFRMPNYQLKRRLSKNALKDCSVCPNEDNTLTKDWKKIPPLEFEFVNPMNKDMTYNMQIYKGLRSVILSAKDADFMINHPVGKQFYTWIEKSSMTEEHFYSSLVRIKVDPKTSEVTQNRDTSNEDTLHGLCVRYTHWYYGVRMGGKTFRRKPCFGNFVHAICNFNLFDLEKLKDASEKCLIGNKFSLDTDSSAVIVHWSNIISRSFEETGKFSKTMKQYVNGNERNFTQMYHKKIIKLVHW